MNKMKMIQPNQLNELMIVNPSNPGNEEFIKPANAFLTEDDTQYLGEDGELYRVASFGSISTSALSKARFERSSIGQYFLGEDGTVYEVLSV